MQWTLPVPAGTDVKVRLFLANRYDGTASPESRVFDVNVEGGAVELDDLDLSGTLGHATGHMYEFDFTSDGVINIDFGHVVENPLVNGIEIIDADAPPPPVGDAGLRYRNFSDGTTFGAEQDAS